MIGIVTGYFNVEDDLNICFGCLGDSMGGFMHIMKP